MGPGRVGPTHGVSVSLVDSGVNRSQHAAALRSEPASQEAGSSLPISPGSMELEWR